MALYIKYLNGRNMNKLVLALAISASLIGCEEADQSPTVTVATWRTQDVAMFEHINEKKLLGDLKIEVIKIDINNRIAEINSRLSSPNMDIFVMQAGAAQYYKVDGYPLTFDTSNIFAGAKSEVSDDSGVYGVAYSLRLQAMQYDQNVFNDQKYSAPKTFEELTTFLNEAESVSLDGLVYGGKDGWVNNQILNEVILAGMVADNDVKALLEGTKCFNDDVFTQAYKRFFELPQHYAGYQEVRVPWAIGEAIFKIDGDWVAQTIGAEEQANPFIEWRYMAIPGDNNKMSLWPDGYYMPNKNSNNRDAMNKFLEFTASKEFAQIVLEVAGESPSYNGVLSYPSDRLKYKHQGLKNTSPYQTLYWAPLNSGKPNYASLIGDNLKKLVAGTISAESFTNTVQKGLNEWHSDFSNNCTTQ
jgi:ABC-type glycerol-3-phosphate transport system substrate-binding protein